MLTRAVPGLTPRCHPDHQRSGHPNDDDEARSPKGVSTSPCSFHIAPVYGPGLRFDPQAAGWNFRIYLYTRQLHGLMNFYSDGCIILLLFLRPRDKMVVDRKRD
jgi:hypothetical protein